MKRKTFAFFLLFLLAYSCEKEVQLPEEEKSCLYQFGLRLDNIYGAWEPAWVLDLESSDTTFYEVAKGHTGFILNDHYADAFELRPDSMTALYYVEFGRFCADRNDGIWYDKADTLYISRYAGDLVKLPIIHLSENELRVEDHVNFKRSIASYRKNND